MTRSLTVVMVMFVSLVWLMGASPAAAADSPIGTWVKKSETGKPAMTLTIEEWSPSKAKLTWRIPMSKVVLTRWCLPLDGLNRYAPLLIDGKPSGETMSVRLVDKRHTVTTVKMNGKPFGTSKLMFSEDFKTLDRRQRQFGSSWRHARRQVDGDLAPPVAPRLFPVAASAGRVYARPMDKQFLVEQLAGCSGRPRTSRARRVDAAAEEARAGATPAEKREDGRVAMEYAGLARGQKDVRAARTAAEVSLLETFRPRPLPARAPIALGAVVEVEDGSQGMYLLPAPVGAGVELTGPGGYGRTRPSSRPRHRSARP